MRHQARPGAADSTAAGYSDTDPNAATTSSAATTRQRTGCRCNVGRAPDRD